MVPSELEKVSERLMKRLDEQDALLQRILSANPNPNGANAGPVAGCGTGHFSLARHWQP